MENGELWAIEYCPAQQAFAVEQVADGVEKNLRFVFGEPEADPYVLVGLFRDEEEARRRCNQLQDWRDARLKRERGE